MVTFLCNHEKTRYRAKNYFMNFSSFKTDQMMEFSFDFFQVLNTTVNKFENVCSKINSNRSLQMSFIIIIIIIIIIFNWLIIVIDISSCVWRFSWNCFFCTNSWTCDVALWRFESHWLRIIANAPWFVSKLHPTAWLGNSYNQRRSRHQAKINRHQNPLVINLLDNSETT